MKAREARFLNFLQSSSQLEVPIYQRTYSWSEKECDQLWKDILHAGSNDNVTEHFVGSVVYVEAAQSQVTNKSSLLLIDGQQRLTTLTLILAALAEIVGNDEPVDDFSAEKIRHRYLVDPLEKGEKRNRLILSKTDKATLSALVNGEPEPQDASYRITQNYRFLFKRVASQQYDFTALCHGLKKLSIVDVSLTRDQDNPQVIFESMNSKGLELSQSDLIRNYVLMVLESNLQQRLYEVYWYPMEQMFRVAGDIKDFDAFMRDYLTLKTGSIPNKKAVYEAFKKYSLTDDVVEEGVEALVGDIRHFASYFCAMVLGTEENLKLSRAFQDLAGLKVDVAYPFLLQLYHDYDTELLNLNDFAEAVYLVESYIFRRTVCTTARAHNKTFAAFANALRKADYLNSIKAHFLAMTRENRFPNDAEFEHAIQQYEVYNKPIQKYWLDRFENFNRRERVNVDDYTIEHIIPQNGDVSSAWKKELGENWQAIKNEHLHRMGNLTLTGYNSEYGDRSFAEKRDMENGFKDSPIKLNRYLAQLDRFDEEALLGRLAELAKKALKVWSMPKIDEEYLGKYYENNTRTSSYAIEDHPKLLGGVSKDLFDQLQTRILALDNDVQMEFLKRYVAFKYRTNFVDIVPKIDRLTLYLNMKFSQINDPHEICKDVSNLGTWGNGDVELQMSSFDDIENIIDLINQSFAKQMDVSQ